MKNLAIFLTILFLFSCTKEEAPPEEQPKYFTSCEEMTDITGLNLYPFEPLTEEEYYYAFAKKRQIPEDFLHEMSTKALIYQISRLERYLVIFEGEGLDVISILYPRNYNMIAELLSRPDAGRVLVRILQKIDPSVIKRREVFTNLEPFVDCYYFYECVQMFAAVPEIIGRMTDEEIDLYVDEQLRLYNLVIETPTGRIIPACTGYGLLGFCYVMIRYEFEPFIQLLVMNQSFYNNVMHGYAKYTFSYTSSIMYCIEQFKNREK